jgi:hydroxymethylpyrimidine pyrophosphatase-like HAD family hydrolase
MKTTKQMLIFDVDGVIANPQNKKVTEPEILDYIIQRLEKNEPIAFNTGRSLVWLVDRILKPILEKIKHKKILQNFFASGEKGGTWITFGNDDAIQYHKDKTISVPISLQRKVKNLINLEFLDSMFYDETKETMMTAEMKDNYEIEKFTERQTDLNKKLHKLIIEENLDKRFKIDPTIVATDIESKYVGKGFAIERILKWLKEKNIEPQKFITFGDSLSDIPMPQMLHKIGKIVEFIYVGKSEIKQSYPFPIRQTKESYEKGTAEALKAL